MDKLSGTLISRFSFHMSEFSRVTRSRLLMECFLYTAPHQAYRRATVPQLLLYHDDRPRYNVIITIYSDIPFPLIDIRRSYRELRTFLCSRLLPEKPGA